MSWMTFFMKSLSLTFVSLFVTAAAHGADIKITQTELARRTQELYDAIVPGNQTPWKKYFADDCIFSDEKGRTLDKTKLIADITPMPAGYSGSIKIENVQSRIVGDTAVLSYDCNESETIFGQKSDGALSHNRHLAQPQRRMANHRQPGSSLL